MRGSVALRGLGFRVQGLVFRVYGSGKVLDLLCLALASGICGLGEGFASLKLYLDAPAAIQHHVLSTLTWFSMGSPE